MYNGCKWAIRTKNGYESPNIPSKTSRKSIIFKTSFFGSNSAFSDIQLSRVFTSSSCTISGSNTI